MSGVNTLKKSSFREECKEWVSTIQHTLKRLNLMDRGENNYEQISIMGDNEFCDATSRLSAKNSVREMHSSSIIPNASAGFTATPSRTREITFLYLKLIIHDHRWATSPSGVTNFFPWWGTFSIFSVHGRGGELMQKIGEPTKKILNYKAPRGLLSKGTKYN